MKQSADKKNLPNDKLREKCRERERELYGRLLRFSRVLLLFFFLVSVKVCAQKVNVEVKGRCGCKYL